MTQQSVRTALALYGSGTLNLEAAARKAGVSPAQFERSTRRLSVPVPEEPDEAARERLRTASD